jgi:hypothetical protein
MNTAELINEISDKHVVIYDAENDETNGVFYVEYEPLYGVTFTTDTPDFTGVSTDTVLEDLYDKDIRSVITTLHDHPGSRHSRDYTAEFTDATKPSSVLTYALSLYDNDDWTWRYHAEPVS